MCGICGVMSTYLSDYEVAKFEDLMKLSIMRGEVGSGIVSVSATKLKTNILKSKHSAYDLIRTHEYYNMMKNRKTILVGHARMPTVGSTEIDWVHPHRVEHIVGVHNGTLRSYDGKTIDAKKDSDSKKLFEGIAHDGIKEAVDKTSGAYAMVWIDEKEKTLNFLRNSERPLYFAHTKGSSRPGTIYWASDSRFLDIALDGRLMDVFPIPANKMWTFPLKLNGVIDKPKETAVEKKYPIVTYTGGYYGGYGGGFFEGEGLEGIDWKDEKYWEKKEAGSDASTTNSKLLDYKNATQGTKEKGWDNFFRNLNVETSTKVDVNSTHETVKGHFVGPSVFSYYLEKGCVNCGTIVLSDDLQPEPITWVSKNEYVCDLCAMTYNLPKQIS